MSGIDPTQLLIVDDEAVVRDSLRVYLEKRGHQIDEATSVEEALELIDGNEYDIVLLDIRMPGESGLSLLNTLQNRRPEIAIVMMSGHGNMDSVIEALRAGAADFLKKPIQPSELTAALEKAARFKSMRQTENQLRGAIDVMRRDEGSDSLKTMIVGTSDATQMLRRNVETIARSGTRSVLVRGETGTGKEIVAKALHQLAKPRSAPFIPVNCPALPENLIESELFGHMKGAFTGATEDRMGAFELANGGTLFFDEIADLSLPAQAKILRVLETRVVSRVGGHREREIDAMVIAASNQPLENLVEWGRFRKDLLFRLNMFEVELSPLRERLEDVAPLAKHFLNRHAATHPGYDPHSPKRGGLCLSPDVERKLLSYDYPGNVRELRNIIERAAMLAVDRTLTTEHVFFPSPTASMVSPIVSKDTNSSLEANRVREVLEDVKWNRREAAKILGVTYDALRWRIRKYGLS